MDGPGLTTLVVDGDSAGHRERLLAIARDHEVKLVWVCNLLQGTPEPQKGIDLEVIQVDMHPQSADEKIMNLAGPQCLVVTGDVGLASVCISRGAVAISPRGHWFWEDKMAQRLELRHLFAEQRRAGKRSHGPSGASRLDDERFEDEIRTALSGGDSK